MDDDGAECGALGEAVVFLRFFEDLPDPRQRAKVVCPLDEILLLCLLAVLAGAETIIDMARFGEKKRAFLRRFRPFADGTPTHDPLGDILASLDAQALLRCVGRLADRGAQRLVLGQVAVAEKSNEIVAIPKLLSMLAVEGAVATIDAMGFQREIARTILDRRADYVLALKGNQGTLHADGELLVAEQKAVDFKDTTISRDRTVDGDHGRIETRTTTVLHDVAWLGRRHA